MISKEKDPFYNRVLLPEYVNDYDRCGKGCRNFRQESSSR